MRKSHWRAGTIDNAGDYMLVDTRYGGSVAGHRYDLDLDEVERFLIDYAV